MIVGHGIDIMKNSRISKAIARFEDRFLNRIYTEHERAVCERKKGSAERYTAFWAVKESVMKALGTGQRQGVRWRDIEVCHERSGKPYVTLFGKSKKIAKRLNVTHIAVSMSHLDDLVIASVIFENNDGN